MKLSLATCAEWMDATLLTQPVGQADGLRVEAYSIDSRTIAPGELFFAVAGERFDGHSFVSAAQDRGAVAAVVARDRVEQVRVEQVRVEQVRVEPLTPALAEAATRDRSGIVTRQGAGAHPFPLLAVDDPLLALQRLAAAVRSHWSGTLIGLTGSAGKTTTKEMLATVLAARHSVLKSAGNLNNHFGVPLQLLRLEPQHTYAVIEMGMSNAGEIALLARLAQPNWAVVTNVGMAHAQNFADGIDGITLAKRELVEALDPATGIAFLNADDVRVAGFAATFAGRSVLAGRSPGADVRALKIEERGGAGLTMQVRAGAEATRGKTPEQATVELKFLGTHNAGNALLALAAGLAAGVPLTEGAAALAVLAPGEKRGAMVAWGGARILNDCYNSNPAALSAMIHTLTQIPAKRHIVIAGEMLELGPETGALHAACGAEAAAAGAAWVIGVQGAALALAEEAARAGTPALFLRTAQEAGLWMQRELRPGDVVLLKGSRGVRLEQALDVLGNSD